VGDRPLVADIATAVEALPALASLRACDWRSGAA
jgi:hypothetical protein